MVTAAEMADFEGRILSSGFPASALMEKVGQAMAAWFIQHSYLIKDGVVVLVGPGNNGGDGLVVARELHLAGFKVKIWCPITITKTLTVKHLAHANWLGIQQLETPPDVADDYLWIDALFGLGQSRQLPEQIATLLRDRHLNRQGRLVSLDVPSGICSDSGVPFVGGAAFASFTLTVGLIKQGLVQDFGMPHVGRIVRIDLGFPSHVFEKLSIPLRLRVLSSDLSTLRWPKLPLVANKYQRGRLLVVAGSTQYRGAALLALQGAMASGVGNIQSVVPKEVAESLWQLVPEVVQAGVLDEASTESSISGFLANQDLSRFDSLLIGPGLGDIGENWLRLSEPLEDFGGLLVIDADALNRLSECNEGWKWIKRRKAPTWITPHQAEFRRLFPTIKKSSLLEAAVEAAQLSGAGVLLKGAHSVISERNGRTWQLVDTDPCAARAGLGDLLAGFVAGVGALSIVSEGRVSCEFLAASAFVHAEAARKCKKGSSPSLIFESLGTLTRLIQSRDIAQ